MSFSWEYKLRQCMWPPQALISKVLSFARCPSCGACFKQCGGTLAKAGHMPRVTGEGLICIILLHFWWWALHRRLESRIRSQGNIHLIENVISRYGKLTIISAVGDKANTLMLWGNRFDRRATCGCRGVMALPMSLFYNAREDWLFIKW